MATDQNLRYYGDFDTANPDHLSIQELIQKTEGVAGHARRVSQLGHPGGLSPCPPYKKHKTPKRRTTENRVDGIGARVIRGYAAKFDEWSEKLFGLFGKKNKRGAFVKTLREADIRAMIVICYLAVLVLEAYVRG